MEQMINGSEKAQPLIQDYKEYHTDKTVRFVIQVCQKLLTKKFKLRKFLRNV